MENLAEPAVSFPVDAAVDIVKQIPDDTALVGIGAGWQVYPELHEHLSGIAFSMNDKPYPSAADIPALPEVTDSANWIAPEKLIASYVRNDVAVKTADRVAARSG